MISDDLGCIKPIYFENRLYRDVTLENSCKPSYHQLTKTSLKESEKCIFQQPTFESCLLNGFECNYQSGPIRKDLLQIRKAPVILNWGNG